MKSLLIVLLLSISTTVYGQEIKHIAGLLISHDINLSEYLLKEVYGKVKRSGNILYSQNIDFANGKYKGVDIKIEFKNGKMSRGTITTYKNTKIQKNSNKLDLWTEITNDVKSNYGDYTVIDADKNFRWDCRNGFVSSIKDIDPKSKVFSYVEYHITGNEDVGMLEYNDQDSLTKSSINGFYDVNFGVSKEEVKKIMKGKGHRRFSDIISLTYSNIYFTDLPSELSFWFAKDKFYRGESSVYGLEESFIDYFSGLKKSLIKKYGEPRMYLGLIDVIPVRTYTSPDDDRVPLHWRDVKEYILFWEIGGVRISLSYNGGKRVKLTYTSIKKEELKVIEPINIINTQNL